MKFITGSLDSISKGLSGIQGGLVDADLERMFSSCDDFTNGPSRIGGDIYEIRKAGK